MNSYIWRSERFISKVAEEQCPVGGVQDKTRYLNPANVIRGRESAFWLVLTIFLTTLSAALFARITVTKSLRREAETTEVSCLTAQEAKSLESRWGQGGFLLRAVKKRSMPVLS